MGVGILRFKAHDLGKMALSRRELALPRQRDRQIAVRPWGFGMQANRFSILLGGFALFSGLFEGAAQVQQRIQVAGLSPQGRCDRRRWPPQLRLA